VSTDNPYQAPVARVADRQPDVPTFLPRIAACLALLFAAGILALLMLEIASTPASVRLVEHAGMLTAALAAALVGLGLWRRSPWGWWTGLLGAGTVLAQLVIRIRHAGQLTPDTSLFLGLLVVAFLVILLLPRTIRAFTR